MTQSSNSNSTIRIGSAAAFWGDSIMAFQQLAHLPDPPLNYLVGDYLAEVTMGLLARRSRFPSNPNSKPKPGYIDEIVPLVISPLLKTLQKNNTIFVVNAGGLDPLGLKNAIEKEVEKQGLNKDSQNGKAHKVAAVWGDDLYEGWQNLANPSTMTAFSPLNALGKSLEPILEQATSSSKDPSSTSKDSPLLSLNAYIGAQPIASALSRGATIVVTGRVVDSALIVGPLMHEFGWTKERPLDSTYLDKLATASLAGHIIECGAQATGGNFTDWRKGAFSEHGGWSNMGYGIVEFPREKQGLEFLVTKPPSTGGLVSELSVGEQMLYEVLDPENYLLPDVVLDLSNVEIKQVEKEKVRITGAKGKSPPKHLKCTAIMKKGYKITGELAIIGEEAKSKAEVLGRAILERASRTMSMRGFEDFIETRIEVVGSEVMFGSNSRMEHSREVYLRLSASHNDPKALFWVGMELAQSATSTSSGITGSGSGRARPSPLFSTTSVLINRDLIQCKSLVGNENSPVIYVHQMDGSKPYNLHESVDRIHPFVEGSPSSASSSSNSSLPTTPIPNSVSSYSISHVNLPLIRLAVGRSGDKGNTANIAFIARDPQFYGILRSQVTCQVVEETLKHLLSQESEIRRYEVPGIKAVNFVVSNCLGGGGLLGIQLDRQAKSYAQICLSVIKIRVPAGLLSSL